MRMILTTLFTVLISVSAIAEDSAESSALAWLAMIDSGEYAASWDESAPYFQANLTREDWVKALNGVRKPLGTLEHRKVKKAKSRSSLPGAPDGEYVIFTLKSSFKNKRKATETLTVVKSDSVWKAVGYFIK